MKVGDLARARQDQKRFRHDVNGYLLIVTSVLSDDPYQRDYSSAPDAIEGRWVKSGRMMGWIPADFFEVVSEGR